MQKNRWRLTWTRRTKIGFGVMMFGLTAYLLIQYVVRPMLLGG